MEQGRSGRVRHMEFQERYQGSKLDVTVVTPNQLRYFRYSGNILGSRLLLRVEFLAPSISGLRPYCVPHSS